MNFGYIFYGIGMVSINTFNGSGDTRTSTLVNFFVYWLFQIPLAYLLAKYLKLGPTGLFIAIPVATIVMALASIVLYEKGKWKRIKL